MSTHEVLNQPPPLEVNLFSADRALQEAVDREGASWAKAQLLEMGQWAGSRAAQAQAALANENPPRLRTHDRYGNRLDEVEFHPAWHEFMRVAVAHGVHALPWEEERSSAHLARAALMFLDSQCEQGHGCPISMTYSAVPALRLEPRLLQEWEPRILTRSYDPRFAPAGQKSGALIGMAMTEKQGGSDVRANTTRAVRDGGAFRLTGHKWFCSAPMSDAFLVLAQAQGGLSCFLLPRWTPDGARNRFFLQRLKDKLGNRSNASSEVEFDGAWAQLVGEEGRGVPTILEMVNHTRLDCVIGAAAVLRQAQWQAAHHCAHRSAFGKRLVEQPLMRNVLADLCVEAEAAVLLMTRLARAYDRPEEASFRRIATAVSKYWVCKRAPAVVGEALECLGGNGYVEESGLPRLYREAPLNSIWEGSGNVICLDVLRALAKEPGASEALLEELREARGADRRLDAHVDAAGELLARAEEGQARRLVEALALALQGALLVRHGAPEVADAFCASRLSGDWGRTLGTLPPAVDVAALVERGQPLGG
ncbi:MAG TPA: isovaleryl-CoA dehydrogenase [Myxococcales bacterium]|nr:isovaleryl-CoA dehydrogenase [Myxococcales bacterium]